MNPNERLKKARKHEGLTQEKFGERIGLKQSQIKDIETAKQKVSPEIAELIEINFSIDGWWLLTGKGEMLLNDEKHLPTIPNTALSTDVVSINFYPDIYAAAGYGAMNSHAYAEPMVIDRKFLEQFLNVRSYDTLDIIHISGDSMEPYIHNGEYVIIERNQEAKNGETVIANINGEVYVKRFHSDPFKKWVKLISENKTYDDISFDTIEKLEMLTIVGIVRAKMKAF